MIKLEEIIDVLHHPEKGSLAIFGRENKKATF
jgi:hypothetical protein